MIKTFLTAALLTAITFSPGNLIAQSEINSCAAGKVSIQRQQNANKGTIADPAETLYDVKYVKLDISLGNLSTNISGNVLTRAVTTAAATNYVFELTNELTIDSIKINNANRTFTRSGDVVTVPFLSPLAAGISFQSQVYYRGTIVAGSSFFDRGLRNVLSGAANKRYTFTLSQPYGAKDWWPCKQELEDKIDSSDVWITVDTALKAGSNGILTQITPVSLTKKRFEWKSRTPIDYYLISVAVGNYDEYKYYMHFSNSADSMLMQNYIYQNTLTIRKPILDSTALMMNYFSNTLSRYPFWKEKYGHSQAPLDGGMEHQTMTTLGIWTEKVVAHELAHQWFGDNVTCASWKDIWLNEGWASYCEYLYIEHIRGTAAALAKIYTVHQDAMFPYLAAMPDPTGVLYVADTMNNSLLFSTQTTYNKGSSVAHMLRFVFNDDTVFFRALRNYQTQFANNTVTTEQFKTFMALQSGMNLDTFFNQWVYKSGWPVFNTVYNQIGNTVFLKLNQTTTGNHSFFTTPLEIKLHSQQGDTTIRVYTNTTNPIYSFTWNKQVQDVIIDPNDWLLDAPGTVDRDNTLSVTNAVQDDLSVYPNPVQNELRVRYKKEGTFELTDIAGRKLRTVDLKNATGQQAVDMSSLTPGIYLYRIYNQSGMAVAQGKLVKQ